MTVQLRLATTHQDREAVFRLRYRLYVEDQGMLRDVADHQRRWLTDRYDPHSSIFLAEAAGRAVGTMRTTWGTEQPFSDETQEIYGVDHFRGVVDASDAALATRLLVQHEYRGTGLAFRLLEKAFELAADRGIELIVGNCEPCFVNHYRKYGFRPFGPFYNHPINGLRVRIAVIPGDLDFLRRIDSPMLAALSQRPQPVDATARIVDCLNHAPSILSEPLVSPEEYRSVVVREMGGTPRGLLRELSNDDASYLLKASHRLHCQPGTAIIRQGQTSRTVFLMLSGSIESRCDGHRIEASVQPGELFGTAEFLGSDRRQFDVLAGPDGARVIALDDKTLRATLVGGDSLAAKLEGRMQQESLSPVAV